jgi:hypothetical protein
MDFLSLSTYYKEIIRTETTNLIQYAQSDDIRIYYYSLRQTRHALHIIKWNKLF